MTEVWMLGDRLGKLITALRALKSSRYKECRSTVAELRDYFESELKQHEFDGLDGIAYKCNAVLQAIYDHSAENHRRRE
jgi:hypothetical protein